MNPAALLALLQEAQATSRAEEATLRALLKERDALSSSLGVAEEARDAARAQLAALIDDPRSRAAEVLDRNNNDPTRVSAAAEAELTVARDLFQRALREIESTPLSDSRHDNTALVISDASVVTASNVDSAIRRFMATLISTADDAAAAHAAAVAVTAAATSRAINLPQGMPRTVPRRTLFQPPGHHGTA